MVRIGYIPDRGDIVWIDFNPTKGHEQGGKRPAFVVSSKIYNSKSHLALICPITSKAKSYPFEVPIVMGKIKGVILTDQIRSIDWDNRDTDYAGRVDHTVTETVQGKLRRLIES